MFAQILIFSNVYAEQYPSSKNEVTSDTSIVNLPKKAANDHKKNITLRVAVAANFTPTLAKLAPLFTKETGIKIQIISGASGNLFQQIMHGAPFDIFFSADKERPKRLVSNNLSKKDSIKTYAVGTLSFWSSNWGTQATKPFQLANSFANITQSLLSNNVTIAIANPTIAPYGLAAKEALEHQGIWQKLSKKQMITGININQTFQQTRSGAVDIGIVATSQLVQNNLSGIEIPTHFYTPIEQQLAILSSTKNPKVSAEFVAFILSQSSQNIIRENGYHSFNLNPNPMVKNTKVSDSDD